MEKLLKILNDTQIDDYKISGEEIILFTSLNEFDATIREIVKQRYKVSFPVFDLPEICLSLLRYDSNSFQRRYNLCQKLGKIMREIENEKEKGIVSELEKLNVKEYSIEEMASVVVKYKFIM